MGSMRNDNQRADTGELLAGEGSSPGNEDVRVRPLTPAARRARAEAEERRRLEKAAPHATEVGGRDGPEPTRFGDWENGGLASDF